MSLPVRPLTLLLLTAVLTACSGAANPPTAMQSDAEHAAQSITSTATESAAILGISKKTKIRLVAPMEAVLTRTGVVLSLADTRCEHKPVPKHLEKHAFPMDAATFSPPHSASIPFAVSTFANPCEKRHSDGVHMMSVVGPPPTPAPPPTITGNGYYAIAVDEDANGRLSAIDAAGPATIDADGTVHFAPTWVPLSASHTYAFYLATVRTHSGAGGGHDEDDD